MSEYKERKSGELWELIDKGISSGAIIVKEMLLLCRNF
ncbi:hypothetical protein HRbin34_00244 [bacterium HR34]|nr:hypothetical protein HRbin34_00244 [bacterium HR34]